LGRVNGKRNVSKLSIYVVSLSNSYSCNWALLVYKRLLAIHSLSVVRMPEYVFISKSQSSPYKSVL
jgi:hypothetical protein